MDLIASNRRIGKSIIRELCISLIMFCGLLYAFSRHVIGGEMVYDTFKGLFFWQAMIAVGCVIVLTYAVCYKNVFIYIFTAVYFAISIYLLLGTGFKTNSPDLWNWYIRLCVGVGTVVPVFVDAIMTKRIGRLNKERVVCLILLMLFAGSILYNGVFADLNAEGLILIVLVYLIADFKETSLERFMRCFAWASVANSAYWLLKSLISVPYTGEALYKGIFQDSPVFAELMGLGAACGLAILVCIKKGKTIAKLYTFLLILMVVTFFFMVIAADSRNALLAVIGTLLLFAYLYAYVTEKKKVFWIVLASIVAVGILVIGFAFALAVNSDDLQELFAKFPKLRYLAGIASKSMRTQTRYGILPDNSWINCIDNFTSGRLSIWVATFRQLNLFKGNSSYIYITETYQTGVHNAFLAFMNQYGIIGGLSLDALMIYSFVGFLRRAKNSLKQQKCDIKYILPALMSCYCLLIFLFEAPGISTVYVSSLLLFTGMCINTRKAVADENLGCKSEDGR